MKRRDELAARQQALLLRSAELRARLALQSNAMRPPLALADQVADGWRWLQAHPAWPAAIAVTLIVARPARAWRWGRRVWSAWQLWRGIQRKLVPT